MERTIVILMKWGIMLLAMPLRGWTWAGQRQFASRYALQQVRGYRGDQSQVISGRQLLSSSLSQTNDSNHGTKREVEASFENGYDVSLWSSEDQCFHPYPTKSLPVLETWRWCDQFVVRYGLCPWAKKSVETPHAIHIYVVPTLEAMVPSVQQASREFCRFISANSLNEHASRESTSATVAYKDPNTAISFVIFLDNEPTDESLTFLDFYNEYLDLEDIFYDEDEDEEEDEDALAFRSQVTLAAFHPEWTFADDNNPDGSIEEPAMCFEKRSPYPTVSIVAYSVIDAAGPKVTEQIARTNADILARQTPEEWKVSFDTAIRRSDELDS